MPIDIYREKKKEKVFRCENLCMLNNAFIRVESRYFAYDNNRNNVKQCRVSIRERVHDRMKRKTKSGKQA
jgi:hypothetical protein